MIHFLFLTGFAFFVAVAFAVFSTGDLKEKFWYGSKVFAQFVIVSLVVAWIFYFLPF
jgi:hypothetical protein